MSDVSSNIDPHQQHALALTPRDGLLLASAAPDTDTAVVFVHGFRGDPVTTWTDFQGLIDDDGHCDHWSRSDVYFFTYDDHTDSIDDSATSLTDFLNQIYPEPSGDLRELFAPYGSPRRYNRLILVGHSEGAVVLRACIAEYGKLIEQKGYKVPHLQARLVLFAPAMMGFVPTRWLGAIAAISGIREFVNIYVAYSTPATEMQDGTVLKQIQSDTERLHKQYPDTPAFSAHVLFGKKEQIVVKARYIQDRKYPAIAGKDHFTICKPSVGYKLPLRFVTGD